MKFRKSPHRTEKALRHAQKPANPRSANPIGPESTYVVPGEDPPMANPPQGPKNDAGETLPGPSRPLLRLAKVTQKRGFFRRFSGIFPAVLPVVSRRFSGGFPAVFRQFYQWSPGGFQRFFGGFPAVSQRFPGGFPPVSRRFDGGSTAVFRQHASPGSTPSRLRRTSSSERNCRQFRTHFQAYKPSIAAFSKVCL